MTEPTKALRKGKPFDHTKGHKGDLVLDDNNLLHAYFGYLESHDLVLTLSNSVLCGHTPGKLWYPRKTRTVWVVMDKSNAGTWYATKQMAESVIKAYGPKSGKPIPFEFDIDEEQ